MGQLYILDLTKRGVSLDKAARGGHRDVHTVRSWNAIPGQDHPKDARGRWTDGHPSVGLLGDMPDVVGKLSDSDLKRASAQSTSLAQALQAESKRRAAETQAAKPLKATRPAKAVPAELQARIEIARVRPMRSDITYLQKELPKLTVAQLEEISRQGNWADTPLPAGNKAQRVSFTLDRIVGRLRSEATTHQGSAKGSDYDNEYRRRLAAADARGDREEYAALVAGFGIGGTGPGLPPEKGAPGKWESHLESLAEGHKRDRELLAEQLGANSARPAKPLKTTRAGAPSKANETRIAQMIAAPKSGDREELAAILSGMTLPQIEAVVQSRYPGQKLQGGNKAQKVGFAVEHLIGYKLNSEAIRNGIESDAERTRRTELAKRLRGFQGDAEGMAAELKANKLTAPQLKALADELNVSLPGAARSKAARERYISTTLAEHSRRTGGYGGNQREVREASERAKADAPAPAKGLKGLEDKVARLAVALDTENRKRAKTSRIQSPKESKLRRELTAAKRELQAARDALEGSEAIRRSALEAPDDTPLQRSLRERGAGRPGSANLERLAGGSLSDFGKKEPTHLDTPRRTSGDGQFHGDHYHGDGQMGSVIERLKPDQARINVGGKRLDDALADVIIMGHSGEKGVSARQVQEWKRIAAEVEAVDMDAARRIRGALADIAKPSTFDVEAAILPSTPGPLGELMREVNFSAANYFETDAELKVFAEMARKWDIGEMSALQMVTDLMYFSPRRHESQEGYFEIRAAAQRAAKALEASGFKKTPRRRPQA